MAPKEFPMLPADAVPGELPGEPAADLAALDLPPAAPVSGAMNPKHPPARQTLGYLRNLLQSFGLRPKNKLGQNFLIDLNLLDLTCRAAELSPSDSILEVGTGTGSLTALMADAAGCVFTVEIDSEIQRMAERIIGPRANVNLHRGDALAGKNLLNPEMLAGWANLTRRHNATQLKLVANLPYAIATPLMSNLLISDLSIERMVVMVQWEIAQRIQAVPNTKDYSALSVLVQSLADVDIVRKVAPTNFFPQPKVDSAILRIRPNPAKRALVGNVPAFRYFLRDLYVHRRKSLRQALAGWPTGPREKPEVDAKLAELGIDGTLRSESLSIADHLRLAAAFPSAPGRSAIAEPEADLGDEV